MRVLILGLPKTGTTGLYYKIINSFQGDTIGLFEPSEFCDRGEYSGNNIIAKCLLHQFDYDSFKGFDKKILIIRDLRDWEISRLLYLFASHLFYDNADKIGEMLRILKLKEAGTKSVSVKQLVDFIDDNSHNNFKKVSVLRIQQFMEFYNARGKDFYIYKYEDFVDGNFTGLESYLQKNLYGSSDVGATYQKVVRTKSHGNWKNWFTDEDVAYYKPIFQVYMDTFGYKDGWELNSCQNIDPMHCSEYVIRVVNERRLEAQLDPCCF